MRDNFKGTDPDAYVARLDGWRRETVEALRAAVLAAGGLEERIKWGHLVYLSNGPVCLIRAEEGRVLLGYWRGRRLTVLEPRLKPGGKFELANVSLTEGDPRLSGVTDLTRAAMALNAELGDPTRPS
ncbi:MAG: DUF1801 domain-containing protein [Brevundimonas sp.]|nr:MAG: DUF1801 domain-containing protein [Brevundimonas sp.]